MANRFFARAVIASLLVVVGMSLGCNKSSPTGPTPPTIPAALTLTSVIPKTGLTGDVVRISGTGFLADATVTLDGVVARVAVVTSTLITAIAPAHAVGTVDVVVANPGGESATLTRSYTYEAVVLTASSSLVTSGDQLSVNWVAPSGRSFWDWVGLFNVGDPNTSYGWYEYTKGATSGTLTLTAPIQPGQYEFRYLLDDGFVDAARSGQVTVRAGGD